MEDFAHGLTLFAEHFQPFTDKYRLIGGAAMWLLLDAAGLPVRTTKDLDIVLSIEVMDRDFGSAIWGFVRNGGYSVAQKSTGKRTYYRFVKPEETGYPVMLEIFSRSPDGIELPETAQVTPVPISDEVSSLSAILLDESYYSFIHDNFDVIQGIPVVTEIGLIPMKAKAWIDLTNRKSAGERIDSRDIKKHRGDVFRLSQLVSPDATVTLPTHVKSDLSTFLFQVRGQITPDILMGAGLHQTTPESACDHIAKVFAL